MRLEWVGKDHIAANWGRIGGLLYLATRQDPVFDVSALYGRLMAGNALLFKGHDGADGYLVITLYEEGDELIGETTAMVGRIDGGPKCRIGKMRAGMSEIETALKAGGVSRHRICGRDYRRIFPDYASLEGVRNGLEKVLR